METCTLGAVNCLGKNSKVINYIATQFAFYPPKTILYSLSDSNDSNNNTKNASYTEVHFKHHLNNNKQLYPWIEIHCYRLIKPQTKHSIIVLYIKNTSNHSYSDRPLFIYSHGNAEDLGLIFPFLIDFSTQMKTDVVALDYSGYGYSEGSPSEKEICDDLQVTIDFCIKELNYLLNMTILFGYSLGSISSVHACSQLKYSSIKGLILLAPVTTGFGIVNPKGKVDKEDNINSYFSNYAKAEAIHCPTLLIHGKNDQVIPYKQSLLMAKDISTLSQWYPSKGNHSNIVLKYRMKFYNKIQGFLKYLFKENQKESSHCHIIKEDKRSSMKDNINEKMTDDIEQFNIANH